MKIDKNRKVVQNLVHSAPATSLVADAQISNLREIATLWAGYGSIICVDLKLSKEREDQGQRRFILKVINPPQAELSDGGQGPDEGHLRKLLSYRVEANFYRGLGRSLLKSSICGPHSSISTLHSALNASLPSSQMDGTSSQDGKSSIQAILLDDIRDVGFPHLAEEMRGTLNQDQTKAALRWLAHFHAHFAGYLPSQPSDECPPPLKAWSKSSSSSSWNGNGVWQIGGYSYVETRLTELEQIPDNSIWARLGLKGELAYAIDWNLSSEGSPSGMAGQTLIHGDVKSANLAFSQDGHRAAAYDFQFVGRGVGVTDLAKFLTTSVSAATMNKEGEDTLLRYYHDQFISAVKAEPEPLWTRTGDTTSLLESRRAASEYSFEDFLVHWDLAVLSWQRFQAGWGAWGNVQWTQTRAKQILERPGWTAAVLQRWRNRTEQAEQ
ncbi:hypothetical protein A4X13_0g5495 [Tilletia indica]|uniref:CHK kinase-like domain-containing protein n=1 Tax=Tilletia indica TaxID=43049 RepID=A0A177TMT8_9BASI|nr:hypothetical protein A4X13_0g5495 [Tilletia indica]